MHHLNHFRKTFRERVETACTALKAGQGIIIIDDEDRENEGDLIFSAEKLSQDHVNQMIQDCSGIICLCLTADQAKRLSLKPMVANNTNHHQTAFTTSIE